VDCTVIRMSDPSISPWSSKKPSKISSVSEASRRNKEPQPSVATCVRRLRRRSVTSEQLGLGKSDACDAFGSRRNRLAVTAGESSP
jgi:hypothetical protein